MFCSASIGSKTIAQSNKAGRWMLAYNSMLAVALKGVVPKHYCTKPIDMKQIARANKENSSMFGMKKPVKQKVKKVKSAETAVQSTEKETDPSLPDWFSVVLESPLQAEGAIDTVKHQKFKDFVEDLELKYLPSVTTVIKETQSKKAQEVLKKWKEDKTEQLGGPEQFQKYQNDLLHKGLNLHKCIELYLKGERDFAVAEGNRGHWESVQSVLGDVKDVKLLEMDCVHPEMFYRGKVDCVAVLRDTLCLIEWKTSSKLRPILSATYDNPVQVVAYMGAVNRGGVLKQHSISHVTNGALVIAYPTGEPATVHMMSPRICERYWQQWLTRLFMYWTLQYEQHTEPE